jgi:hypothetical protein
VADLAALDDEVAEVLAGELALALDFARVFAFGAELLDGALETDAEVVGRRSEDLADGRGDALAVGVDVVDCFELGGDLGREPVGERMWDLAEDVVDRCGG